MVRHENNIVEELTFDGKNAGEMRLHYGMMTRMQLRRECQSMGLDLPKSQMKHHESLAYFLEGTIRKWWLQQEEGRLNLECRERGYGGTYMQNKEQLATILTTDDIVLPIFNKYASLTCINLIDELYRIHKKCADAKTTKYKLVNMFIDLEKPEWRKKQSAFLSSRNQSSQDSSLEESQHSSSSSSTPSVPLSVPPSLLPSEPSPSPPHPPSQSNHAPRQPARNISRNWRQKDFDTARKLLNDLDTRKMTIQGLAFAYGFLNYIETREMDGQLKQDAIQKLEEIELALDEEIGHSDHELLDAELQDLTDEGAKCRSFRYFVQRLRDDHRFRTTPSPPPNKSRHEGSGRYHFKYQTSPASGILQSKTESTVRTDRSSTVAPNATTNNGSSRGMADVQSISGDRDRGKNNTRDGEHQMLRRSGTSREKRDKAVQYDSHLPSPSSRSKANAGAGGRKIVVGVI